MRARLPGEINWQDAELVDLFRRLWDAGVSREDIATRFGCSKDAIIGKSHRLGFPQHPNDTGRRGLPSPRKTTDEQEVRIRDRYAKGIKISQLAREESVSDHVIDRVLGFPNRGAHAPARRTLPVLDSVGIFQTVAVVQKASKEQEVIRLLERGVPKDVTAEVCGVSSQMVGATARMLEPVPVKAPAPIHVVRRSSCLWPTGTRTSVLSTFGCCGDRAVPGKPYCEEHAKLAYVRVRDRKEDVA